MFCRFCGTPSDTNGSGERKRFCTRCGAALIKTQPPVAPVVSPEVKESFAPHDMGHHGLQQARQVMIKNDGTTDLNIDAITAVYKDKVFTKNITQKPVVKASATRPVIVIKLRRNDEDSDSKSDSKSNSLKECHRKRRNYYSFSRS